MLKQVSSMPFRRRIVKVWFALDAVLALAPPLCWTANGRMAPVVGIPTTLVYFLTVDLCITASLIGAYLLDTTDGERTS